MSHTPSPRRLRRRTAALGVVAALALLPACGSDDGPTGDPKVQTIKKGTLQCAMSGEYRPFNFYGEDTKLQGFDVDVCTEIAKRLNLEAEPVTGQFNTLIAGLQAGRFDTVIGSMANTPERAKQVDFSEPYYETGAELFVGKDSSVKSIKDLDKGQVGVTLGTTFEEYAKKQKNVGKIKTYKSDIEALKDLEAGRLDAVITQGLMGRYLIKNTDLKVQPVGGRLYDDIASIPVKKGNTELKDGINTALKEMKSDGKYAEISKKWFGEDISAASE